MSMKEGKILVFPNPYVNPRVRRSMLRLYVKIFLSCKIFEKRWPLFFQDYKTQPFYVRIFFMCEALLRA